MVLVVIGVLIWNFSTRLQHPERQMTFSEFMTQVNGGAIQRVIITGQDISGDSKVAGKFHTYAPAQYDGLVNRLLEKDVQVDSRSRPRGPGARWLFRGGPGCW